MKSRIICIAVTTMTIASIATAVMADGQSERTFHNRRGDTTSVTRTWGHGTRTMDKTVTTARGTSYSVEKVRHEHRGMGEVGYARRFDRPRGSVFVKSRPRSVSRVVYVVPAHRYGYHHRAMRSRWMHHRKHSTIVYTAPSGQLSVRIHN